MFYVPARGLGERNAEMVQRNHMEQFYCNLCAEYRIALSDGNGRLQVCHFHILVSRSDILIITGFTNFFTAGARTPRMRQSYTMEPKKLLKNVLLQGLGGDATLLFYVKVSCCFSMGSSPCHCRRRATTRSFLLWL